MCQDITLVVLIFVQVFGYYSRCTDIMSMSTPPQLPQLNLLTSLANIRSGIMDLFFFFFWKPFKLLPLLKHMYCVYTA